MKKAKPGAAQDTLPKREKRSYYWGGFGQGMIYAVMSGFIADFQLNVLRLNATFVLLLMLLARIWDAVNDPLMGFIMDRVQPKGGKMRPYLYVAPWPAVLLTLVMFLPLNYFFPDISPVVLMVCAAVSYVGWDMVYTVGDVPYWSLPNVMVADPRERGSLVAVSRLINGIGSAIPQGLFMAIGPLLAAAGFRDALRLEQTRYMLLAFIACAVGGVLYFQTALHVRERVPCPKPPARAAGEPGTFALVLRNKPLLLVVAMGILSAGRYMFSAAAVHVARYSIGIPGRDIQSSISFVSLIMQAALGGGQFLAMILLPKLMGRFRYKTLVIGTGLLGGLAGLAVYFLGYGNIYILIPLLFICSVPFGIINPLSYAMAADSLDYMEWKTGFRNNGFVQATQTFVNKFDNALATSAVVLTYILLKLDVNSLMGSSSGASVSALDMAPAVRGGFFLMISLVPAISLFLCVIPMFFYDLEGEKKDRVTRELAERRAGSAPIL